METLKLLSEKPVLSPGFRAGTGPQPVLADAIVDFHREVDIEPLVSVVRRAMAEFDASRRVDSDKWLAPRVHATLRLTRREAADNRLWQYLAVVAMPEYVRWRFPGSETTPTTVDHFLGLESKQALSRLWWAAEFFRDGADYSPVSQALSWQNVPNSFLMRYFHNKPLALAAARFLPVAKNGEPANSDEVNAFLKAANLMLTTTVLDAIAPDPGPDPTATRKWVEDASPDETLMFTAEPEGPEEDPTDAGLVDGALSFLVRVAAMKGWTDAATAAGDPTTPERRRPSRGRVVVAAGDDPADDSRAVTEPS